MEMGSMTYIPSFVSLVQARDQAPEYMRPNVLPTALVYNSALSNIACDAIVEHANALETYSFKGCGALTREFAQPLDKVLDDAVKIALWANATHWRFALDPATQAAAWMQTYTKGQAYPMHTDAAPGQSRKLTAVVLLTDPLEYGAGDLWIKVEPRSYIVPRGRGSIVVFPSWVPHFVDPISRGKRQTINIGFWGPPFQ